MLSEQNETKLIELFRVCVVCKSLKGWLKFNKEKKRRLGIQPACRLCQKLYADAHKKENNIKNKIYYKATKEKRGAQKKIYYKANRDKLRAYYKAWYEANKDKVKNYNKNNKDKIRARKKIWYKNNKDYDKVYQQANKKRLNFLANIRRKKRYRFDFKYKLNKNVRCLIWQSLKGNKNGRHWESLAGYTLSALKKHLEKLFTEGMTWENYSRNGWTIDHKIPISAFNFTKPEHRDFKRCWALKNLQPMWAKENSSKHNKLTKHFQPSLLI